MASMTSLLKAYSLPLILFSGAVFYQLFVIPHSFPSSYYDVLRIKRYSTVEEVKEAYENRSSEWKSGAEIPRSIDFLKIRYAYELLTNDLWKRNYDLFGLDEQRNVLETLKERYGQENFSSIGLPLLEAMAPDTYDHGLNFISTKDFQSIIQDDKPILIQLYSFGSRKCAQFHDIWKRIVTFLDGVAATSVVELGEAQLAAYLAEKKSTGQPFFKTGIPSLVAFPSGCKSADCLVRFKGQLTVDDVTDWFATSVLHLPRILYYSKETLVQKFLAKAGHHKVKVIFFSETGQRAAPFLRQAAKNYWRYASFAFVLWTEEESSVWANAFGVESAPAIVILKDPGVPPVVHHGSVNSSIFSQIMEQNKQQELPQLRSETSMELGCDVKGYSRAGYDTVSWYCAIVAGRMGTELNKMRDTVRRVQQALLSNDEPVASEEDLSSTPAAVALKAKRLTFVWFDGESQKNYCHFYISSETSYETCGTRRDITDVPRLFIVRYKRDPSKVEDKRKKNVLEAFYDDSDLASQLVAHYNGSEEVSEIIQWVSKIIEDGESRDLPLHKARTPDLVAEGSDPLLSEGAQRTRTSIMQWISEAMDSVRDRVGDPRIGPFLLLGAIMSFGSKWLGRSQRTQSTPSNQPSQPDQPGQPDNQTTNNNGTRRRRTRVGPAASKGDGISSITDVEPKDAYQMPLSDSDSDSDKDK